MNGGDMYDSRCRGDLDLPGITPESVLHRHGSIGDYLARHNQSARQAWRGGIRGMRELVPHLFRRIADERTMRLAWDYLAREGGTAPGPNGHRYRNFSNAEVWDLCRALARAVRDGTYRPGSENVVWVDKTSGQEQRPIVLQNIEDRVVQRAIAIILQPLLDPLFLPCSYGYRPRRNHLHALAHGEWLTLAQRRRIWVTEDIRNAFWHIPTSRLMDVVRCYLPTNDVVGLLQTVLPGQCLRGLRQGGSLSPMFLNLYLHYFLDDPWERTLRRLPLIRYADDLLVTCLSGEEATTAYARMSQLLRPTGMRLKGTAKASIVDLDATGHVDWLGFTISKAARGLSVEIANRSWRQLERYLALAHLKSDAPLRANRTIFQWLNQRGPSYRWSDRQEVCQRIITLAGQQGFEEVPGPSELTEHWQRAYARWQKLRKAVRETCGARN